MIVSLKGTLNGQRGAALLTALLAVAANAESTQFQSTQSRSIQAESMSTEPDMPHVGRSLFDKLTGAATGQHIAFPYEKLVTTLRARAGCALDACTQQVLIPLGRSLQRAAAVGEYFRFPRVVTAFTGEASSDAQGYRPLLRDRLYLGYQAKSNILEVISYNDVAGRFEFQLVRNYGAGLKPQVVYAQRTLCLACHQNRGPIFSRPLWQETNANPLIAEQLRRNLKHSHGVPIAASEDVPRAIQEASQRANQLQLAQTIWQAGCGGEVAVANACRAALLGAALRYRLNGGQGYDARLLTDARRTIAARWHQLWPSGLRLLSSDLPNRMVDLNDVTGAAARRAIYIAPQFDPLATRAVAATWTAFDVSFEQQVVATLAGFFSSGDVQRLDRYLQGRARDAANTSITLECADLDVPHGRERVQFDCRNERAQASGRAYLHGNAAGEMLGAIDSMNIDADHSWGVATLATQSVQPRRLALRATRDGLSLRAADGRALSAIELAWPATGKARLTMVLTDEIKLLDAAIANMAEAPQSPLQSAPFNRDLVLTALDRMLNTKLAAGCCQQSHITTPLVEARMNRRAAVAFDTWCSACHVGTDSFPPAFLRGTDSEVQQQLRQCAPRIYQRLSMWQLPAAQRNKTPMPPATVLPVHETSPQHAVYRREFKVLADWAEQVVRSAGGATTVLRGNDAAYELLPLCVSNRNTNNLTTPTLVTQGDLANERH